MPAINAGMKAMIGWLEAVQKLRSMLCFEMSE